MEVTHPIKQQRYLKICRDIYYRNGEDYYWFTSGTKFIRERVVVKGIRRCTYSVVYFK